MDELKLLEKMLRQREEGELPDYQGEGFEQERYAEASSKNSPDGIIQGWLDQMRWKKTEELRELIWEPESRSSFASMVQQCAMQVLLEREGENYVKRLLAQNKEEQQRLAEWHREHDGAGDPEHDGISAAIERGPNKKPLKDAKNAGGVKNAEIGQEEQQARAKDRKAIRQDPVSHQSGGGAWGHMETWLEDNARAVEKDGHYAVKLNMLDLHNQVYIKPKFDPAWSSIEDFEDHYGKAHDPSFATYEGVLLHENQHVEERKVVYLRHLASFRHEVASIEADTAEEALAKYEEAFQKFEQKIDAEYHAVGEIPARALEWEYYHAMYEKETGERGVSRGSARAAGAALGKKESEAQQSQLTMSALAGPARSNRTIHAENPAQESFTELANEQANSPARRIDPEAMGFDSPAEMRNGGNGALGPGAEEVQDHRPQLLALVGRTLKQDGSRSMRFQGISPLFSLGERRVMGAKAGIVLDQPELRKTSHQAAEGVEIGETVDWLLRWWGEGAEEQRVIPANHRG